MYVCKRIKLCSYLLKKGFTYEYKRPDKNNKKYNVWIFKMSPELMNVVDEYYSCFKQD